MPQPFASARALIGRAEEHINTLDGELRDWVANDKSALIIDDDLETQQHIFKLSLNPDFQLRTAAIVFDAVNCLRSALDHAVFDSAVVLRGEPKPKYTKFPFSKNAADVAGNLDRKDSQVPESIRPWLLAQQPYKNGKRALWELNELRNGKIHRILSPGRAHMGRMGFGGPFGFSPAPVRFSTMARWDDEKGELSFLAVPLGSNLDLRAGFTFSIVFGEDTPFFGKEPVKVLRTYSKIIARIVRGLEAETIRLSAIESTNPTG